MSCPTSGLGLADEERPGAVAVPAVVDRAGVDRHDLAVADRPVAGDAVDDLVVDRDAEAGRERVAAVAVALERRHRAGVADVLLGEPVEVAGRDAGLQLGLDEGEDLGDDPAGVAHLLDLAAGLAGDHVRPPPGSSSSEARMTSRADVVDRLPAVDRGEDPGLAVMVDDVVERRDLLGHAVANGRLLVVGPLDERPSRRGRRCPRPGAGSRAGCRRGRSRCRSGGSPSGRRGPRAAGRCRSPCRRAGRPPRARRRAPWPGRASGGSRRGSRRAARRAGRGGRGTRRRSSSRARAGPGSCSARPRGRAAVRAATAARSRSPDASTGTPRCSARIGAWVPFPAPGAPRRTMTVMGSRVPSG